MNTSRKPASTPGSESGSVTARKARQGRAAEVHRGLQQRRVLLRQAGVERQHGEGQVAVGHAEIQRELGEVQDLHGFGDHPGGQQVRRSASPDHCRMPIQAVTRSRKEVQKGSITSKTAAASARGSHAGDGQSAIG